MPREVEFLFDYGSPWSYLASEMLEKKLPGCAIAYRPVYLRGLEAFAQGIPYGQSKLRYLLRDMVRCAEVEGVPLRFPEVFPINGLHALRGAIHTLRSGGFPAYHRAMFRATWADNRNVSDRNVVLAIAEESGLDRAAFVAGIEDAAVKATLKDETAKAQERGVFGVPSFFVGEELFWGHDRLDYVRRAALG
jgi:2-hydroxychromene-2-carboxylate isomerase